MEDLILIQPAVRYLAQPNPSHDTITLLRFMAIALIVAGHFDLINYGGGGGAALLMMIVGYNFSKFKLPKILAQESVKPIVGMIVKVVIPTVGYTLLLQTYYGSLQLDTLLLISNYSEARHPMGFAYWFIEVYVQIQILMLILFAFSSVRRLVAERPALFIYGFCVISVLMFLVAETLWDMSHLYRRLPYLMLWIFAFGFAAQNCRGVVDKLVLSALFIIATGLYYGMDKIFFSVMAIFVIWNPALKIPKLAMFPIAKVASASLFIYLTHFQVKSVMEKIIPDQPFLYWVAALLIGYCISQVYQAAQRQVITRSSSYFNSTREPI